MSSPKATVAEASLDMRPEDRQELLAHLRCRNCSELADSAVDTQCCHALLCADCLAGPLGRVCPTCGVACTEAPNHLARRMIGCQPWRCQHCGAEATRFEAADHDRMCPGQPRRCPAGAGGCQFVGATLDAFLDHVLEAHKVQVLRNAGRLFFSGAGAAAAAVSQPEPRVAVVRGANMRRIFLSSNSRDPSRNHMETSGKAYCGRPLNGPPCSCCDGHCGPSNGCNCCDCMRLDLAAFGIVPGQRALVNREGCIARVSPETRRFYCGRPNMGHDPATDGFCGPNNGNNCHACRQLDEQARGRYASIVNEWG